MAHYVDLICDCWFSPKGKGGRGASAPAPLKEELANEPPPQT